ncbi:MAG TPA: hypothetical protein VFC00_02380 [Micromonosporaceae bacterium]|nr:hypothetical protein [Micromonosporaceae bacterium]
MRGMAVTWHATPGRALGRLVATAGPAGLILGRDHSGAFVPVRLLRPEPTHVVLIGGSWAARLITFRCLGLGARVNVVSGGWSHWTGFGERAGAPGQLVLTSVGPGFDAGRPAERRFASSPPVNEPPPDEPAGSTRPVLHVYDVGPGGPVERPQLAPWHTQLTVLPQLTVHGGPVVAEADVVLLQRLDAEEASLCEQLLRLPPDTADRLQQMHDDMLAVLAPGADNYVWFAPTPVEYEILGGPHRD